MGEPCKFEERIIDISSAVPRIEAKTDAINEKVDRAVDGIDTHISNGGKWRLFIAGTAATLICSLVVVSFEYGKLVERVSLLAAK
jgi:hypothetical protein